MGATAAPGPSAEVVATAAVAAGAALLAGGPNSAQPLRPLSAARAAFSHSTVSSPLGRGLLHRQGSPIKEARGDGQTTRRRTPSLATNHPREPYHPQSFTHAVNAGSFINHGRAFITFLPLPLMTASQREYTAVMEQGGHEKMDESAAHDRWQLVQRRGRPT